MAAYLNTRIEDNGLSALTAEVTKLHITSAQASSFANVAVVTLGNKATPTVSAPAARGGGGRKVTISAITDGVVTATGTATSFALVDEVNSRLLATQLLASSHGVTSGDVFTLTAFDIGIPDPA